MKYFILTIYFLYGLRQSLSLRRSFQLIPTPLVLIEEGQLKGFVNTDWKGGKFFSFLSIPYAKKPIGKLRFKDPLPPDDWDGIRDATQDMPRCIQHNINLTIVGREDCLYLNVHTPRLTGRAPVMVFIHGGGYITSTGKADYLGPEFLLAEDIVLVTFNYRLGLFGFLNFDDPTANIPGNAGMKDQLMVLKWVQRNIHKFGGNPKKVTIFGQCAGGSSVHFHMMSKLSKPLFHRAIALSGTALHVWAMGSKDSGMVVAKMLGYKSRNPRVILKKLQKATPRSIMSTQEDVPLLPLIAKNLIGPVVERAHNGTVFLSEPPEVILGKGTFKKCPFILGATDKPSLIYDVLQTRTMGILTPLEKFDIIPYTFNLNSFTEPIVYDEIMDAYNMRKLVAGTFEYRQLVDDLFMNYFLYVTVTKHAKKYHDDMYLYKFSASTRLNFFKYSTRLTARVGGASHMDDIAYLFKNPKSPPNLNPRSKEGKCVRKFVKLFVNFARTGDPTPRRSKLNIFWEPVEINRLNYLHFHTNFTKMKVNPFEMMEFWDGMYRKFGSQYLFENDKQLNRRRLHLKEDMYEEEYEEEYEGSSDEESYEERVNDSMYDENLGSGDEDMEESGTDGSSSTENYIETSDNSGNDGEFKGS